MLTRTASFGAAALCAAGLVVAVGSTPAQAGPGPGAGESNGTINLHAGRSVHRSSSDGDSGPIGGDQPSRPDANCAAQGLFCRLGAPQNNPAPQITTADLVASAKDAIELPVPQVRMSPARKSYVNLRTYLWLAPGAWGTKSKSVGAAGQNVTATATPSNVQWNLGESTITCNGPGTPRGGNCSYTYKRSSAGRPGGTYRVTATITWSVNWTCTGPGCDSGGGALPDMTMTSQPVAFPVGEIQTTN